MEFDWDEVKRQWTLHDRGLDFADVARFGFSRSNTSEDRRAAYGEVRYSTTGPLDGRTCVFCWLRAGRPIEDFPDLMAAVENLRAKRGLQVAPTKERIGLRLDRAVVEHFRATGPGWQLRINALLAEHVRDSATPAGASRASSRKP